MASAALHNITNKLNPSSSSKSKSKKKPGAKNLEPPVVSSEKSSALNSPHNGIAEEEENSGEPAHVREVTKQMRNINKKLNAMAKVDTIIAENHGTSLDDLVAARKINADQKAQALKKPQLQAQLASLEAQLNVFSEIEEGYEKKTLKEKQTLLAAHAEELSRIKEEAKVESEQNLRKHTRAQLLNFSRFLAAAANRRNLGDDTSEEARAFEGALLLVYGGDINAVDAAEKIITGSSELVPAVDGTISGVPFSRVKELSLRDIGGADTSYEAQPSTAMGSDPTIANAGLTEIDDLTTAEFINGIEHSSLDAANAPAAASIGADASNAAADAQWDPTKPGTQEESLAESYEIVPRGPAEVDVVPGTSGGTAQPRWSDEVAAEAINGNAGVNEVVPTEAAFQEVTHHRGGRRGDHRGDHRGGFRSGDRGRGGRGGRGYRGDGRGRGGRGGGRGHGEFRGRGRGGAESS